MSAILGQPVEVGAISKELKKLWEQDEAATNASLMNLAVYSEEAGALEKNSEAIVSLTREHACRAILVEMEREAPEPEIESWVTAHCHLAHGRKTVCCEQLAFRLKGKAVGRMRNTLFSNLNSDLPLVFWWQGELSDLFEERLYRLVSRLIVDTSEWSDVAAGFRKLHQAVEDSRCQMAVQDLAWTRTYHFRLGLAGLFDDPRALELLDGIHTVRIAAQRAHWASAWMMIAWLGTQAKWVLESQSEERFVFLRSNGEKVTIELEFADQGAPLSQVLLTDGTATVEVRRKAGDPHLELELNAPGHIVRQAAPADPDDKVDLVAEQLSRGGKNSLFRKIWPLFFEMLGLEE
ncbi:glucose-6-phosphate dehydrogenase assembly protein OpcA [Roseibacillus ishigakijimensis]|uniref:Glucose-6-phosphate dehydrogenase assembly protein OpcA n=1 Tax=Roseibacillus ishigakijimensis TaxID=454146 RepID=A0A934RMG2_9BACT|nr:glucose-6-phosphate dehydrogenase assembly protein OpcA [Roseibacillus ishigakijimensis]MBK1834089.1 glucose-6-phosphate dehydrogenase assembly protein OpcA [Roseibacillus ishigakijimensis]